MALCVSVDVCFVKRDVLFFPAKMSRKLSLPTELKPDLGKPWSRVIQTICMEMQFISLTSTGLHHIPLVQSYLVISLQIGKLCRFSLTFAWDNSSTDLTSNPFLPPSWAQWKYLNEIWCFAPNPLTSVGVLLVSGAKLKSAHSMSL